MSRVHHIGRGFTLNLGEGESVDYAAGRHTNVPDHHAEHWYFQVHCVEPSEAAAPETLVDLRIDDSAVKEALAEFASLAFVDPDADEKITWRDRAAEVEDRLAIATDRLTAERSEVERLKAELVAESAAREAADTNAASAHAKRQDAEAGLALEAEARAKAEADLKAALAKKPGGR